VNIALVLLRYFPYGGLQRDMLQTAELCRDAGHRVRILAGRWEGPRPEGIEVELLPVRGRTNHGRARDFARRLQARLAVAPPDRVLGFDKLPGLDLYFAADPCFVDRARRRRSPLYRLTPRYRTFASLERALFGPEATTRILLLDPRQQVVYRHWYGTGEDRFVQLPPGAARDRAAGADAGSLRSRGRAEFGVGEDESLVLLLGSDFRRKGLDRAIRALADLPETTRRHTRLLAVGQDDPRAERALARRLGVADRLWVQSGRDDVPVLLQAADLLIHPAREENTGMVLAEALAGGLPVLCSGACGHARHVRASGAGSVLPEPFRQQDLDAALAGLLADDREPLRARALDYAGRTDLHSMHERILEALEAPLPEQAA
jgi:UDP-glucose:(heptosyl)LPS alpha-1,3-glucosyltransferase